MPKTNIVSTIDESKFGTSVVNYVGNAGAESTPNSLTPFNVAIVSEAPSGAPTLSSSVAGISVDSATPLRGTASYRLNLSNTFSAGTGHGWISDEITIVSSDLGKVLEFSLEYKTITGAANLDLSGLATQTLELWIYDVTAAAWVQPAGFRGINAKGVSSSVKATFQTSVVSGQKYRLALLAIRSPSSAPVELNVDSLKLGPAVVAQGTPVTDWVDYTPVWTASVSNPSIGNGTLTGKYRRVGGNIEVNIGVILGSTTSIGSGTYYFSVPSAGAIDLSKTALSNAQVLGLAYVNNAGIVSIIGSIEYVTATTVQIVASAMTTSNNTGNSLGAIGTTYPGGGLGSTPKSGDYYILRFSYPAIGLSSTVQMSNDTDTRVVAFSGYSTAATAFTGSITKLAFTSSADSHAGWSADTYTVPVSGYYKITAQLPIYTPGVGGNGFARIYIDSTSVNTTYQAVVSSADTKMLSLDWEQFINAGQQVSIRINNTSGTTNLLGSVVGAVATLAINRLSGSSVIAATETVAAIYTCTAGQSIAPASIDTMYAFTNLTTKVKDTHGAFNSATGTFTAPVSGTYQFSGSMTTPAGTATYRSGFGVNSSTGFSGMSILTVNTSVQTSLPCSYMVNLLAGQTVTFGGSSSSAGAQTWGAADGRVGWINIVRVGN